MKQLNFLNARRVKAALPQKRRKGKALLAKQLLCSFLKVDGRATRLWATIPSYLAVFVSLREAQQYPIL